MAEPAPRTLLVTVTGADRPGVTSAIFEALSAPEVEVVDVEQVVVRGRLTLGVLVAAGNQESALIAAATAAGRQLGMQVSCLAGQGDSPRRSGRAVCRLRLGSSSTLPAPAGSARSKSPTRPPARCVSTSPYAPGSRLGTAQLPLAAARC